jgi:glycosyltransferase involved in cell wall biosynthesis
MAETPVEAADRPADPPADRQRVVLVLPSTGEFDSRTFRIASSLLERGHEVTVIARWSTGLPRDELHPAGYRIIRVPVAAIDGLPFQPLVELVRTTLRRRRRGREVAPTTRAPASTSASGPASISAAAPVTASISAAAPATPGQAAGAEGRRASLPRRLLTGTVRRLAIPLTIRAHIHAALAAAPPADLYHGMAYMGIPVALALGKRHHAAVVYDARDIYLEARNLARSRGVVRWALARAERGWAHRASRVITVNDAYADVMAERLRVERPLVVMNCSRRFTPPQPPERRFHVLLDLGASTSVILYHGGLFPDRGIEQLMAAMPALPDATLVLMGYGALEERLREAAADPALGGRVRLVPPVRPDELHDWVASADIVAMPIQPSTLNHRLTTPNKLFEAMASGVAVVASDLPGMSMIIAETGCGIVCDGTDVLSLTTALRELLADPARRLELGRRGLAAAHATYSWERQAGLLLAEYSRLTSRRW